MRSTLDWWGKIRRRLTDRRNRLSFLGQTLQILLAPFQRLTDDFVLIRAGKMPQKSFASFFVNERGKASAFWAPPGVQLNHVLAVIDASLKRWRVPHFSLTDAHYARRLRINK
jgi:hypothetical protein